MSTSGVPPGELSDEDLLREMRSLHRTRDDTLRHGPDHALAEHDRRTAELEREYVRRFPNREISRGEEGTDGGPDFTPEFDPAVDADFATEHSSPTFADQLSGGPEHAPEAESPHGYSGMENR